MLIPWAHQQAAAAGLANPAAALIARMSPAPDAARQLLITNLIDALVVAGIWTKLDCFYILAAHASQPARLNWKGTSYTLSAVNAPTFTVDRGYTGDGSSSYLSSGFVASTAGGQYTQNSCTMGVRTDTAVNSATQADIGNGNNARILSRSTSLNMSFPPQSATSIGLSVLTSAGHNAWSRHLSTTARGFKDGLQLFTDQASTSTALAATTMLICSALVGSTFSTRRIQAGYWGSTISVAEMATLHAALTTYMTAVGV